ncbi:hypothetical protein BDY24DRAFT_373360 [Mrakia frigida]|uniref:protein HGH1 n=1 Tax=Mrakia frigida TaxID=29902 RepID=UPI003FCC138E
MSELAQLLELVPFLRDANPQARQLALSHLLGHTVKTSPHRSALFFPSGLAGTSAPAEPKEGEEAAPASSGSPIWSLKLLCRDQPLIAHDAFSALVNMGDSAMVQKELGDDDFLVFLVSYIINPTSVLSSLASMLLSNLTSSLPLTKSLSTLLIPYLPLLPDPKSKPAQLQTYYLPSSRCASATPPGNLPRGDEEVTVEFVPALSLLVEAFVQGGGVDGVKESEDGEQKEVGARKGDVHFLATVFSNLSVLPPIRQALLSPALDYPKHPLSKIEPLPDLLLTESLLSKLLIFTEHKDTIRRGGVLSTLKHIALSSQTHPILLASEDVTVSVPHLSENPLPTDGTKPTKTKVRGVDVLPKVLGPLMGGEEIDLDEMELLPVSLQFLPPTKERERDPILRLTCVEILLLLATTLRGRQQLRARGAYTVIKFAHKVEVDNNNAEQMHRLVNLLQRDEGPETKIEELGPEDESDDEEEEGIVEV